MAAIRKTMQALANSSRPKNLHTEIIPASIPLQTQPKIDPTQFRGKLRQLLIQEGLKETVGMDGSITTRFQRVAERIFDEAEAGEAWAAQMVFDRVEGKAAAIQEQAPDNIAVLIIRGASTDEL